MPARSNDFQRLITIIEASLAPSGATVTESAMLFDASAGIEREIDVLVEYNLGLRTIRAGIECRDRSRPAGADWVDSVISTHECVGVDTSVLVSRSGFSGPALAKAQAHGIQALTLEEATNADWAEAIGTLTVSLKVLNGLRVTFVTLQLAPNAGERQGRAIPVNGAELIEDGVNLGNLVDFVLQRVLIPDLNETIANQLDISGNRVAELMIRPHASWMVMQNSGEQIEVDGILVELTAHVREVSLKLSPSSYGSFNVAHGYGDIDGVPFMIYLKELPQSRQFDMYLSAPQELFALIDMETLKTSINYSLNPTDNKDQLA